MIKVKLTDGSVMELESPMSAFEIAQKISMGLARAAFCAKINGEVVDLRNIVDADCDFEVCTFDSEEGKRAVWHSTSHIMAQAVKRLYPEVKLAIGPATATGFYYDFDTDIALDSDSLTKIEAEMKKIIKEKPVFERFEAPRDEALKLMADEPYKVELINDLPEGETISFYRQGEFLDLCAGPHVMDVSKIKAIKLLSVTGAYWRGSEKNKMLKRIYGISFLKASELEEHLKKLEEAKLRDHNKIGRELRYFTTNDYIGQGLPLLMPKGTVLFQILSRFVEDEETRRGYVRTRTPYMAKSDLYKLSGHWDHYRDGMFVLGDPENDDEVFALRPMTCPFQYMVYKNDLHSYRDLPIRYGETSTLFRNEASGEMHGLIRVRQFTISEGHLILTPEQLEDEFKGCLDLVKYMMTTLGLYEDLSFRFSRRDPADKEKYIGTDETWDNVEELMRGILNRLGIEYKDGIGEAAFYGPKLDIQIKNAFGKEDTLITIQIDPHLAEQFDMVYVDRDGQKKRPYIIHRTSIGCYERTMALLLEKYMGALPFWMSPEQIRVMPLSQNYADYACEIKKALSEAGFRVTLDERNEKIGYKIREAQVEKIPYMVIVGEKERAEGKVAVRSRNLGDLGTMELSAFLDRVTDEEKTRAISPKA